MSALIEQTYRLLDEHEQAMWGRAASVAQDERRTPVEAALALDVTQLLQKIAHARRLLAMPMPPNQPGSEETGS